MFVNGGFKKSSPPEEKNGEPLLEALSSRNFIYKGLKRVIVMWLE